MAKRTKIVASKAGVLRKFRKHDKMFAKSDGTFAKRS
jgi:hypothetical protein